MHDPAFATTQIPAVSMRGITKYFGPFCANDHVDFSAAPGEIHALLGENGAGKTTLMHILSGRYRPDAGEIQVYGVAVKLRQPADAFAYQIGMVHQHFQLVENMTVLENVLLGNPRLLARPPGFWQKLGSHWLAGNFYREALRQLTEFGDQYHLHLNPNQYVRDLAVGQRQRVELLKALYRQAQVLILDEPTSVLTPQEARTLFHMLYHLRQSGRTIIFITHKLQEVMEYAQRATVLRKGKLVGMWATSATTQVELARAMIGAEFKPMEPVAKAPAASAPLLSISEIHCRTDDHRPGLRGLSLAAAAGQITGIAGVAGNGQEELAECLAGLIPLTAGQISLAGRTVAGLTPRQIIAGCRLSYIPAHRLRTGVAPGLSLWENFFLKNYRRAGRFFLNPDRLKREAAAWLQRFDVRAAALSIPVRQLSGGNLQKLILARELADHPQFMVAVYPTRGLDIAATKFIQEQLKTLQDDQRGMLYISDDLDEILLMADAIAVIHAGKIVGRSAAQDARRDEIGLWMAGGNEQSAPTLTPGAIRP